MFSMGALSAISLLFILFALALLAGIGFLLYPLWKKHLEANDSLIAPIAVTVISGAIYAGVLLASWSVLQNITTSRSSYESGAEIAEQKAVEQTPSVSQEEALARTEEKRYLQATKPHEEALSSFEESMKREADKIRERSLNQ